MREIAAGVALMNTHLVRMDQMHGVALLRPRPVNVPVDQGGQAVRRGDQITRSTPATWTSTIPALDQSSRTGATVSVRVGAVLSDGAIFLPFFRL